MIRNLLECFFLFFMQIIHATIITITNMMMTISANPDNAPYTIYIFISADDDVLLGANGRDIEIMMMTHINNILIRYEVCFQNISIIYFGFKVYVLWL